MIRIPSISERAARTSAWLYGACGLILALYFLNLFVPVVRFANPVLNWWSFNVIYGICLSMPILGSVAKRHVGWLGIGISACVALLLMPLVLIWAFVMPRMGEPDLSFMPIQSLAVCGTRVVVYRTDGGATTDYGIVVRQEKELAAGMVLVRRLYSEYHRQKAIVRDEGNCVISIHTGYVETIPPRSLKRQLYF